MRTTTMRTMTHAHDQGSLNRVALSATAHCLTGCAIGEVLGVMIGTALGWGNFETIVLAIALAFLFGYSLTMLPLLRAGLRLPRPSRWRSPRTRSRSASWSSSTTRSCWSSLARWTRAWTPCSSGLHSPFALLIAGICAYPVNRYLIARGKGHAVVHAYHGH